MVALWNCYILLSILYIVCVLYYIRNVCVRLCLAYQFFIRQNLPNQVWMEEDLNIGQRILLLSCTTTIFVYVAFMYCALFTTGTVNIKTALHNIHLQLNFPTESHIFWTKLTSWHWRFFFFLPYIYFFSVNTLKCAMYIFLLVFNSGCTNYAQAHNVYQYSMELCKTKSIRLSRNRVKLYGVW